MKDSNINNPEIQNPKCGTLYVVSTPIGNLEDITLRALRTLKSVDIIAAENTTHTRGLCKHYGIKVRVSSYNQHNQKKKAPELIRKLKSGANVAIVTDAGTPCISDPGAYLISRASKEQIAVTAIPGASAVTAALSVSGMPTECFVFMGFLPNRSGKRRRELKKLSSEERTMVFFEAPHRLVAMLNDLRGIFGDRQMVILREMTKVFEETKRGPVSAILAQLSTEKIKGELTLVVEGNKRKEKNHAIRRDVLKKIDNLLQKKKISIKDIAYLLASEEGLNYRHIYKECLARKKILQGFEVDSIDQETHDQ